MNLSLSAKELAFSVVGTLVGGIFVWSLTNNIELGAQLKALENIQPEVNAAISSSSGASALSEQALERANSALANARSAEIELNRILTNLNATPLFENIDQSIEQLKEVAAQVAREEAALDLPIGTIMAWHKNMGGTPDLPNNWVEANGQRLDDIDSPYHNRDMPQLNIQAYSGGRGYYLRGGLESGIFNESTYFTDNGTRSGQVVLKYIMGLHTLGLAV